MTRQIQTIAATYHAICQGERPWTALGNFMNEWFDYNRDARAMLIAAPIVLLAVPDNDARRWAAFCAASVEWLCARYAVPCPAWPRLLAAPLPEPWFHAAHPDHPAVQARLRATTPAPFAERNIFCGDRIFANKYEFAVEMRRRRLADAPAVESPHDG